MFVQCGTGRLGQAQIAVFSPSRIIQGPGLLAMDARMRDGRRRFQQSDRVLGVTPRLLLAIGARMVGAIMADPRLVATIKANAMLGQSHIPELVEQRLAGGA